MCIIITSCAIIAEYNPFHNGHIFHIEKTKEALGDVPIICIMSGHFTQRGEPAIADKWTRAKWAISCGCDAVIELPTVYAIQSANRFAGGGVSIANGISSVTNLSFGSESDDLSAMNKIAQLRLTDEYAVELNNALSSGNTYARAQELALSKLGDFQSQLFSSPNCILGIEYLSYLASTNISPLAVKRTSNNHNDKTLLNEITSATSIRNAIQNGEKLPSVLPNSVSSSLSGIKPVTIDNFTPIIFSKIFSLKEDGLRNIHEINEGLENRIYREAMCAKSVTELIERVKTKRYLYTRLERTMLYIMLDITKGFMKELDENNLPVYARLLAVNKDKSSILAKASIPIVAKAADYQTILSPLMQKVFEVDLLATAMYSLFSNISPNEDYYHKMIID